MNKYYPVILTFFTLLACKKDSSPISVIFSGITETNEYNQVLNDDPDDWQPRCTAGLPSNFCVLPAFPNPTDTLITFLFYLRSTTEVSMRIEDYPNHAIALIKSESYLSGLNKIAWNTKDSNGNYLKSGIYRAYFNFIINGIKYESYGDIKINSHKTN